MQFTNLFKNKKTKQEDQQMASTLEQVRKAYEDLSEDDKKTFHQSLSDRVHESIAAQERAEGDEDSQSAEDREHEALGAEHADWKRFDDFDERLRKIEEAIEARRENAEENRRDESGDKEALEKAQETYGLGSRFIAADKNDDGKISPKEAADVFRRFKS